MITIIGSNFTYKEVHIQGESLGKIRWEADTSKEEGILIIGRKHQLSIKQLECIVEQMKKC